MHLHFKDTMSRTARRQRVHIEIRPACKSICLEARAASYKTCNHKAVKNIEITTPVNPSVYWILDIWR